MTPAPEGAARMRVLERSTYRGPNRFSNAAMVRILLDLGDLASTRSNQIPGFVEALVADLPELWVHHCGRGHPGGFIERLVEGTLLGHVVEHVALDLPGARRGRGVARQDPSRRQGQHAVSRAHRLRDSDDGVRRAATRARTGPASAAGRASRHRWARPGASTGRRSGGTEGDRGARPARSDHPRDRDRRASAPDPGRTSR